MVLAGGGLGITGFLDHTQALAKANTAVLLKAAAAQDPVTTPVEQQVSRRTMVAVTALSMFTFILLTPQGWAATYLLGTGAVRSLSWAAGDPHGDLLLTAVDATVRRIAQRRARTKAAEDLVQREGPAVPDRVYAGAAVGLPGVELVVVTSRVRADWTLGTVVLTGERAFRITHVEDRVAAGRLRHVYGLAEHTDQEAFRRVVQYEFPAGGASMKPRPGAL